MENIRKQEIKEEPAEEMSSMDGVRTEIKREIKEEPAEEMSSMDGVRTAIKREIKEEPVTPEKVKLIKLDISYLIQNINRGNVENVKLYFQEQKTEFKVQANRKTPLHFAAQGSNAEIVELLIKNGHATMDAKDGNNKTPVHIAFDNGHLEIIECFLKNGARKFLTPADIENQIRDCFIKNRLDILKCLVDEGGIINDSLIYYGVTENRVEILEYLLEFGNRINRNPSKYFFLHKAAELGNVEILRHFWFSGFNVAEAKNFYQKTPLHLAVAHNQIDAVKFLLQRAAKSTLSRSEFSDLVEMSIKNDRLDILKCLQPDKLTSSSMIHVAAANNRLGMLKYLMECGASSTDSTDSYTPLHAAAESGNIEIVKYLVENGYKIRNSQNSNSSKSPLDLAVISGRLEVVEYFIAIESEKIIKQNHLFDAVENGHLELLKLFIDRGCGTVFTRGMNNYTLVHSAAYYGHLNILKYLIANGAGINEPTNGDETPIVYAIKMGHVEIVRELMRLGARNRSQISADQLEDGMLALLLRSGDSMRKYFRQRNQILFAAEFGYDKFARALIESGADVNAIKRNQTPLDVAVMKRHSKVVRVLLEGGASAEGNAKSKHPPLDYVICQKWATGSETIRIQILQDLLDFLPKDKLETYLFACLKLAIKEKASFDLINSLLEYDFHYKYKISFDSLETKLPTFISLVDHVRDIETFVEFQESLLKRNAHHRDVYTNKELFKLLILRINLLRSLPRNSKIGDKTHAQFVQKFHLEGWNKRCEEEIACMRHMPGGIEISYYDFLTKPLYKVENLVTNDTLTSSFSNSAINSHLYDDFFKIRVQKIKDRRKFLDSSKNCMYFAVRNSLKIYLPEDVVNQICEYLSILELKRLAETRKFVSTEDIIVVDENETEQ